MGSFTRCSGSSTPPKPAADAECRSYLGNSSRRESARRCAQAPVPQRPPDVGLRQGDRAMPLPPSPPRVAQVSQPPRRGPATFRRGARHHGQIRHAPAVRSQRRSSVELFRVLREEFGLVSAYHGFLGVEPGQEAHPTFYMNRKQDRPFHIDYCFIPDSWAERVVSVEVGSYSEWTASDHRPVTMNLAPKLECRTSRNRRAGRQLRLPSKGWDICRPARVGNERCCP